MTAVMALATRCCCLVGYALLSLYAMAITLYADMWREEKSLSSLPVVLETESQQEWLLGFDVTEPGETAKQLHAWVPSQVLL